MVEITSAIILGMLVVILALVLIVSLIKEFPKKCPFCGHDLIYDPLRQYFICPRCKRIILEGRE